ncbi:alpha/beta-hydrolase [Amylostereum chailletii]|nr:alpha/beta-hydrolase [Amylostereum chailletii]
MLDAHDYTLRGTPEDGELSIALTRYRLARSPPSCATLATERLALLFVHGVSSHKECWLPTIERLFELHATAPSTAFDLVEAWAIDSPNHGHAAALNEKHFLTHPEGITAYEWGRAVQVLLSTGLISGTSIVGIGHSAGACVTILSTTGFPTTALPYASLILIEPPMMSREILARAQARERQTALLSVIEMAKIRKDVWVSREEARTWFAKRLPWKRWTERALGLYIDHALRDLPTGTYPDVEGGVTLACTRVQEAVGYVYHQDGIDSLDWLKELCPAIPVHCIFGGRLDMVPEETKRSIVDESEGRRMTSVTHVAGAGHLVVQEDPDGLALAIWGALHHGQGYKQNDVTERKSKL